MTIVSGSKFFKKMDFKIIKPSHITEIKEICSGSKCEVFSKNDICLELNISKPKL